ncbi:MAG TPA: adenosine deaminase [Candidatus Rubrimentiphilum sp.]|nr:adenosine deaminase [Candidatus Rubrimentiphilum sp.]
MLTPEVLRALPKVQLHCHLEGTLRATTFVNLAHKHGVALTYRPHEKGPFPKDEPPADPSDPYAFRDFEGFLLTFAAVSRSLAEPADYGLLAKEYLEDATAQNVVYAELFISPSVWQFFHKKIDVRACVAAIRDAREAARKAYGIETALIVDLTRNFGVESAMRTARLAVELRDLGIVGIGLGGDEAHFPPELFEASFAFARESGLHCVAHAGESAGAPSVRAAIEVLHAERIGHGIRALEDPSVVQLLVNKKIPLEVCPTSNFLTGVALGEAPHPLVDLDAAGCIVTIDADDPAIFKTSVTDELAYAAEVAGDDAPRRFTRNAIEASFSPDATKARLRERLEAYSLEQ